MVEYRSFCLRRSRAATILQAVARGAVVRWKLNYFHVSAGFIQYQWRRFARRQLLTSSTTKIQTLYRSVSSRQRFLRLKASATKVQRLYRGFFLRRWLAQLSLSATVIQSSWRRHSAQNSYLLELLDLKSAVLIQATFRMYTQRMDYMIVKFAADKIQRCTRGLLVRLDVATMNLAALDIQKTWRSYSCTVSFQRIINGVVNIQSLFRRANARKQFEEMRILHWSDVCFRRRKVVVIQKAIKEYMHRKQMHHAAAVIQSAFRFYSQLKQIQLVSRGMIQLQSVFRGSRVRTTRSKRVAQIAQRIELESRRALNNPAMCLGNRTDRALYVLQTSQSLTKIMDAVKELEASTRLSVVCCQVFTKVHAADILLQLIQSCNRSVPHMELKEHILLTLENVAQYPSLVASFAHFRYAEVFLDNVQVFRDKDGIFCLAVSLLDRISKVNDSVAQFCATHEHLKRLKEVYRVVGRHRLHHREGGKGSHKGRISNKYPLKKRNDFNRDSTIKILGEMIETFSALEPLPTPQRNNVFNFDMKAASK